MKKKSLVTMLASVSLVAVVGVGATLAFLSDSTGTLVNTFSTTTGYSDEDTQAVKIQETKLESDGTYGDKTSYGEDGFTGNAYTDLLPGDVVTKDPNVLLGEESIDSYVFIKLEGADALAAVDRDADGKADFSIAGFSSKWEKVDGSEGLDGYYVYKAATGTDAYKVAAGTQTEDLFTTVTYNTYVTADTDAELPSIELTAYAVQYKNVTLDEAKTIVMPATVVED